MPPKRRLGLRIFATARIAGYHVPDGFLKKYLLGQELCLLLRIFFIMLFILRIIKLRRMIQCISF